MLAHGQLTPLTEQSMESTIEAFLRLKGGDSEQKHCLNSAFYDGNDSDREIDDHVLTR